MWELEKFIWENVRNNDKFPVTREASEFRVYNKTMGEFNYKFIFEKLPN